MSRSGRLYQRARVHDVRPGQRRDVLGTRDRSGDHHPTGRSVRRRLLLSEGNGASRGPLHFTHPMPVRPSPENLPVRHADSKRLQYLVRTLKTAIYSSVVNDRTNRASLSLGFAAAARVWPASGSARRSGAALAARSSAIRTTRRSTATTTTSWASARTT